ncbi:MAG: phycobiliprotein lyase [Nostocaceae cyanobacterium]|nr:phycobiliprotein lyase [Nostocaceae cyanobacterium]
MDAMEFFQLSAGRWQSTRTTHHLAFKRSELGESEIFVETLAADDPEIITLCQMHEIDPSLSIGGSRVRWLGTMAWDREGEENHEGKTVFAIVPETDNPRKGRLLRERGYAEIVPVVGRFHMDDEDGLVLTTEYETMSSTERFWFATSNMRMRTSTVKRFGGFSTASFCAEVRVDADLAVPNQETITSKPEQNLLEIKRHYSLLGW